VHSRGEDCHCRLSPTLDFRRRGKKVPGSSRGDRGTVDPLKKGVKSTLISREGKGKGYRFQSR